MPMYWDAYLADTTHLTTEEHGAYMLLLAAMWRRNGCVPDDDADNARILGLTKAKWRKVKVRLEPLLIFEGETISQEKLRKTWQETQQKISKNRENGRKGGRPKQTPEHSESNDIEKANGSVSDNPNESIPDPDPDPVVRDTDDKAREELTLREAILSECGVDPISGITGPHGGYLGTRADMAEADRWQTELGLTQADILSVVRDVMSRKSGPPSRLSYFNKPMMERAGEKSRDPLSPAQPRAGPRRDAMMTPEEIQAELERDAR